MAEADPRRHHYGLLTSPTVVDNAFWHADTACSVTRKGRGDPDAPDKRRPTQQQWPHEVNSGSGTPASATGGKRHDER